MCLFLIFSYNLPFFLFVKFNISKHKFMISNLGTLCSSEGSKDRGLRFSGYNRGITFILELRNHVSYESPPGVSFRGGYPQIGIWFSRCTYSITVNLESWIGFFYGLHPGVTFKDYYPYIRSKSFDVTISL